MSFYPDLLSDQPCLGIDPGATGGVALVAGGARGGNLLAWRRFDGVDPLQAIAEVVALSGGACRLRSLLEEVHAAPGQGVVSMFTFGRSVGRIEGYFAARDMALELASPQAWQRWLPGHDGGPKERVRSWVESRHGAATFIAPGCRVPHQGGMDAAAIAEYLRLLIIGAIEPPAARSGKKKLRPLRL